MFLTLTKRSFYPIIVSVFTALLFFSCQKELSIENGGLVVVTPPDLTTKVSATVSGFVTDENDAPVLGATVQVGTSSVATDKFGYFEARNVQVVKTAATVTVNMAGYFKGIKTWMAEQGKAAFFRIKLIPKTIAGTINGAAGGKVILSTGFSITLPAGAVINAATNMAYTGTVNVAAYWMDPTATDLNKIMPGDLRGLDVAGGLKLLRTFGMAAVELTGAGGELLQIGSGQKATLSFPIPASIAGEAPASIPLWYFDESNGLWKEQGSATKNGNNYVGDVGHFSFWNCDTPGSYVQFSCTVHDQSGNPIHNAVVKLTRIGTGEHRWGATDSLGYVSGPVPDNAQLQIDVYPIYYCIGTSSYTQTFNTTNTPVNLGTITIAAFAGTCHVTGTLTNCSNNPVTDGYVMMYMNNDYYREWVHNGVIDFTTYICNATLPVTFIGVDPANSVQSSPVNYTLVPGINAIGTIQACGTSSTEFINYSIDGTAHNLVAPPDSMYQSSSAGSTNSYISGSQFGGSHYVYFSYDNTGIGVGTTQTLNSFYSTFLGTQPTVTQPASVSITEYGPVGQFISGNFTCTLTTIAPAATYNIACSFRVRRNN